MKEEKVFFENSRGQKLCGLVALQKRISPAIILVHGMMPRTDKHEYGFYDRVSIDLFKEGYSIFRFDFHAHGESEGNYVDVRLEQEVDDLKCAIDFLLEKYSDRIDIKNIGILATSFGANPAIILNDKRIKSLVLSCPFIHLDKEKFYVFDRNLFPTWREEFEKNGFARLKRNAEEVEEKKRKIGIDLWTDLKNIDSISNIKKVNIPICIIAAGADRYVKIEDVKELFKYANEPKKLIIVENADHGFSDSRKGIQEKEIKTFLNETRKWFDKWLK